MILKDIESLSDAEKLALVKAVQESVAANKAKQTTQEVGQYAKLVVDAIKKIKTDLEERYAAISAEITVKAAAIKDGKDGQQGPKGEKGDRGFDGANGRDGANGKDGKDGADGNDGVSVSDARIDFDGSLVIALSNGREINAGEVVPMDLADRIKVVANGGGTSQYVLDLIADLQTQISAITGGLTYKGTWNASTNSPTLASSTGTTNWYYVVSVAGTTNLDGITDWQAGDWVIFNGTVWQKIDQSWAQAGANSDITSLSGITGGIATADYVEFDTSYATTLTAGRLGWDGNNTLGLGMSGGAVIQKIGEDFFYYVKASSAITKGQLCMFTGSVGASGVATAAPASGVTNGQTIMGIAAESISHNGFGLIQVFGTLKNVDTSAFADNDVLYYNSAVTGGFTTTFPASGPIVTVAAVVNGGSAGGGVMLVRITVTQRITASTGISVSQSSAGTTVTNSAPDQVVSLIGSGTTSVTGTYPNFTISSADSATGTVTSVGGTGTVSGLTLSGTVTTSGNLTLGGTLAVTPSDFASQTANYVLAAPNGSSGAPTFRALVAADVPTLNQNTTGSAGSVVTTGFSIVESGGKLVFKYGTTVIASMSSTGVITSATNIVANGTP